MTLTLTSVIKTMPIAKPITILLTQVFFCAVCFGQREQINSLKKALPSLHDSARIDCLNTLSEIYLKYYNALTEHFIPDNPKYYADAAYKESKRLNYVHGIAESLSCTAEFEFSYDHFPEAENFSREALYWYKRTTNKKRLAETYFTFGRTLYAQSVFAEAIKNVDTSYMLYKKSKNAEGICWAVALAAWIYEASGNFERAFELARESLSIAIKNNDDFHRRTQLSLIGNLFRDIENYKTALEYYRQSSINAKEQALSYAQLFTLLHQYDSAKYYYSLVDTTSPRIRRNYLTSIGEYFFEQKLYDKALPNFTRALDYHKQLNDRNPVMQTLIDIAKTYLRLGNYDSALAYGNKSFMMAKQTGARQVKKTACEILSAAYDHRHQEDSAYLYYKQYTSIKDSVLSDQVKGKLAAYTFEQKMALLNKEKQFQLLKLQKQSLLTNILIGGIIILLLLSAVIFRNIALKRRNEKQRLEHELELQRLESKIESQRALLNERVRISREIHDDIGSTLSGIVLYSHLAENQIQSRQTKEAEKSLDTILQSANEMVNSLNDIVWAVTPEHNSLNLMQKLEEYAMEIAIVKNIKVKMKAHASLIEIQLPVESCHNIYLLTKEAINNAVKYSQASLLELSASNSDHVIEFIIKDNGKGFDMATVKKGNGLVNMQKRAEKIGAILSLQSVPGKGTVIHFTILKE